MEQIGILLAQILVQDCSFQINDDSKLSALGC